MGQLDDEAATNITGNIAWEGTALEGNEPTEQPIKWEDVSAATLQDKSTYEKLGWDFSNVWDWNSATKQPVLRGFKSSMFAPVDYTVSGTHIVSRAVNTVAMGSPASIDARIVSADKVGSVTLYYGEAPDAVTTAVPMTKSGDVYKASIPTGKAGDLFYYISVRTDKETLTKPYDNSAPIVLNVDDGKVDGTPIQITMTPDTKQGGLRFNWLTDPRVTKSVIQYKKAGASQWQTKSGSYYVEAVTAGYKEKAAHRVEIDGLEPSGAVCIPRRRRRRIYERRAQLYRAQVHCRQKLQGYLLFRPAVRICGELHELQAQHRRSPEGVPEPRPDDLRGRYDPERL